MSEILELTKTENVTKEEHNARIGENYQKLFTANCSELKNSAVEEVKYPSLDAYRPLHTRRELTFEDVQIPEEVVNEPRAQAPKANTAPAIDYKNSIYNDPAYRQAALRREQAVMESDEEESELSMPTGTTLQYGKATAQSVTYAPTAKMDRVVFTAVNDEKVYLAALAKKVAVAVAVAFVVMMVVIAVNSAVLNGMNLQIIDLQQTLYTLQSEVQGLEQAIANETSWETILSFIQTNGMVPMA